MIPLWLNIVITTLLAVIVAFGTTYVLLKRHKTVGQQPLIQQNLLSPDHVNPPLEVQSGSNKGDVFVVRSKEILDELG